MMNNPTPREPGLQSAVLRVVSCGRQLLWIFVGALAPRPVPSTMRQFPQPTLRYRK